MAAITKSIISFQELPTDTIEKALEFVPSLELSAVSKTLFGTLSKISPTKLGESYLANPTIGSWVREHSVDGRFIPPEASELAEKVYREVIKEARLYLLDPNAILKAKKYETIYAAERLQAVIEAINKKKARDTIVFFATIVKELEFPAVAEEVIAEADRLQMRAQTALEYEVQREPQDLEAHARDIVAWLNDARHSAALETVTHLEIDRNARAFLTYLPKEVGLLTDLENLDLTGNRLKVIPPTIGRLRRLHELKLTNNPISCLPIGLNRQLPHCAIHL